jgi:tetratricopeptide (TPR) repeat protein
MTNEPVNSGMTAELNKQIRLARCVAKRLQWVFLLALGSLPLSAFAACPDLSAFYQAEEADSAALQQQISQLLAQCLESSEFFALYGAAQLSNSDLAGALESLERALLLNPGNGAAAIDYAQALFEEGQLFTALEMNQQLIAREDLPEGIDAALQSRQERWRAFTRQSSLQAEVLAGYDNNLNGAPDSGQITLTLSGEPIQLGLDPEFRPHSGGYLSTRAAYQQRQLAPESQQNWGAEIRSRNSEYSQSDLLQFAASYQFLKPSRTNSWQAAAGVNHLQYGGSSLFTGLDSSFRYQPGSDRRCNPYSQLAVQHQDFHRENRLDGLETKVSLGVSCPQFGSAGRQQLRVDLGRINNFAANSDRLGGDRVGWQSNLSWQYSLQTASLRAQLSHTNIEDRRGYSPLLKEGAERSLKRSYLLLEYRRPVHLLGSSANFMINVYHQRQRSNLELFRSKDTSAALGFGWFF